MSQKQKQKQKSQGLPDAVKHFVQNVHRGMRGSLSDPKNRRRLEELYDVQFHRLSEQHYKTQPWPTADAVSALVKNDRLFLELYRELTFRALYANPSIKVTPQIRRECFQCYASLFELVAEDINGDSDSDRKQQAFDLPTGWLWDIVDEFVYQFQANLHIGMREGESEGDNNDDDNTPLAWETHDVIAILTKLAQRTNIVTILRDAYANNTAFDVIRHGPGHAQRMLGYFALIGLMRVHALQGDYYNALKVVEEIDLGNRRMGIFTRIPACHVTASYFVGFSYLMLRRYVDAIKVLSGVASYINNRILSSTRSGLNKQTHDAIVRKYDQCLSLLSICVALCPRRVDSSVHAAMREKYADQMAKLEAGDLETFEAMLRAATPKTDAIKGQMSIFLEEIKRVQASDLPKIKSYIRLFSSISLQELAKEHLSDMPVEQLRTKLMCIKNKSRQLVHSEGALHRAIAPGLLEGRWQGAGDAAFVVDMDKVYTVQGRHAQNLTKRFLKLMREV